MGSRGTSAGDVAVDLECYGNYNTSRSHSPNFDDKNIAPFTAENNNGSETMEQGNRRQRTWKEWLRKYFCEGQALNKTQTKALEELPENASWQRKLVVKHRKLVGVAIPFLFYHVIWWSSAIKFDFWQYFPDKYFMSITMIFGSMVAGLTSEGGGAVAFPVMTLAFAIKPSIARDFSLMIQSCGMTAAAFTIFWMRVQLEWSSLIFCSLGGAVGTAIGLEFVDPNLTPPQKKMGFVCVWFSFAFALFLLNRYHKRRTFKEIPNMNSWKALVLLLTGFIGGIFTSVAGSGLDICSFSMLTLLFRVTEKTATPTSVVLMAGNTVVGFYWRQVMQGTIEVPAYEYVAVCVPIVVLGAPFGSLIGSHFHRQLLAGLVYLLDTVALVSAFVIVKLTTWLIVASVLIIVVGFAFFGALAFAGQKLMERIVENEAFEERLKHSEQPSDVIITNNYSKEKHEGHSEVNKCDTSGQANQAFDNGSHYTTGM